MSRYPKIQCGQRNYQLTSLKPLLNSHWRAAPFKCKLIHRQINFDLYQTRKKQFVAIFRLKSEFKAIRLAKFMNMKKLTLIIGIDDHFNGMAWQLTYARTTISIHNHSDSIQSQFISKMCKFEPKPTEFETHFLWTLWPLAWNIHIVLRNTTVVESISDKKYE